MTGRRLALWLAILAGLQVLAGAAALPELVPAHVASWVQLIVGFVDTTTAVYVGRVASLPRDLRIHEVI